MDEEESHFLELNYKALRLAGEAYRGRIDDRLSLFAQALMLDLSPEQARTFAALEEVVAFDRNAPVYPEAPEDPPSCQLQPSEGSPPSEWLQFRRDHSLAGKGIKVAVLDHEIMPDHPALDGRVRQLSNETPENWGVPHPHATGVAGIIGGTAQFGGVAPLVTLQNVKVFGSQSGGSEFELSQGLRKAVKARAKIINCSFGWGDARIVTYKSMLATACEEAYRKGSLVVKSAGNNGVLTQPAEAENIVVVGATNRQALQVPPYSGRGTTMSGLRPHLVAPGGEARDSGRELTVCDVTTHTRTDHGTSYAAAHVSGLLALMRENDPNASAGQMRAALLATCRKLEGVSDVAQGAGIPRDFTGLSRTPRRHWWSRPWQSR